MYEHSSFWELLFKVSKMNTSDFNLLISIGKGLPHQNANDVH